MNDHISSAFLLQCPCTYFSYTPRAPCNLLSTRAEAWVDSRITYGNTSRNIAIILADIAFVVFCSVKCVLQCRKFADICRHCHQVDVSHRTPRKCGTSRLSSGTASYSSSSHMPRITVLARTLGEAFFFKYRFTGNRGRIIFRSLRINMQMPISSNWWF